MIVDLIGLLSCLALAIYAFKGYPKFRPAPIKEPTKFHPVNRISGFYDQNHLMN